MKVGDGSTAWVSLPYLPAGAATTLSPGRNIDGQLFDGSANITVIAPGTHAATSKATPVDADEVPLVDSAASNVLKKLTWANIKATLFGTPAVVLGTAASAGTAATAVRTDATIVAFDATAPTTQAFGDAAAVGTAAVAARRDHKHAMPSVATNALVLGTAAAAGVATTTLRSDDTIAAFDTTAPVTQAFSDAAAVGTAAFAARRDHKHGMPASPAAPAGSTALVYRYTVVTSDKASIDTGVDTADAGSNDWTNGDLLEIFLYARLDEAVVRGGVGFTLNNDTGNNYDQETLAAINTTVSASSSLARANWALNAPGASAAANYFGTNMIWIPNYAGTVGYKQGGTTESINDSTAANNLFGAFPVVYRSTSAVTRLAVTPTTAAKKLKVGSQLLIYKRLAS